LDKTALKNFAIRARRKLIEEVAQKAFEAGVTKGKIYAIETFEGGFRVEGRENGKVFKKYELRQRHKLIQRIEEKKSERGFEQVMEEVAYTWFNRFIALRFMEVNGYLPSEVRVLSSLQPGKVEPDIIQEALNTDLPLDKDLVFKLQDSGDTADLYKYLLIRQCNQLGEIMPSVFERIEDYTELLLPDNLLGEDSVIRDLVESIEEYDWKIELAPEEKEKEAEKGEHGIEIIGWLYQYYISEKKDEVFAGFRKNIKATKENIPAATQLFTPKWIVKYMVENSLGRLWLESRTEDGGKLSAESRELKKKWKYYLDEAEQEPEVEEKLKRIRAEKKGLSPEDITLLDPAMGSGHILVYAFDLLYDIYLSQGYPERQIPGLILEKNLYGLEIDDRAYQLATFALLMKARSKNRRFFSQIPELNLCSIQESISNGQLAVGGEQLTLGSSEAVDSEKLVVGRKELVEYFVQGDAEADKLEKDLEYLFALFQDAKEYGSILEVEEVDFAALERRVEELRNDIPESVLELNCQAIILEKVPPLIKQAQIMSRKYDVVCTNPPYMKRRNMNPQLAEFLGDNFPKSKSDLFAVFMELDETYLKPNGFMGMINQQSWMFLPSYKKLRKNVIDKRMIHSLLHLGSHAFEEIKGEVVQSTSFILQKIKVAGYRSNYLRLIEWRNAKEKEEKTLEAIANSNVAYGYTLCSSDFSKIPGSPIAYWFTTKALSLYKNKKIIDISNPCKGIDTGDNNRFLRIWHEVSINKQHIPGYAKVAQSKAKRKWFPYNKGGPYHKWYGNNEYVLNYENEGEALRQFKGSNLRNSQYYFRSGITWTTVTSGKLSLRYFAQGYLFDNGGCCLYADNNLLYIMALLNSSVTTSLLNVSPTLNYQPGDIGRVPVLIDENSVTRVEKLVKTNIALSKTDWDSFETSWDFKCHPFLTYKDNATTIVEAFGKWSSFAESQFNQLKQNEKELNRIFIDIYGLQDELTPEVKDEDITINKADRERDIKSFISYAVGCMFGRYSLDKESLIYAGGDFEEKYRVNNGNWEINVGGEWLPSSVHLAANNIIPIVDGDYFEDGILERFVEFVKVSFGKETLEENLDYIAASLGVRAGETPRQAIRRYFLRNFYKDHVRTYKKRPIYWLFDSGRRDGFKALVYLHRYDPYTVARVRTDYLHKLQRKYEAETKHLDILIGSEISGRERAATRRRKENIRGKLQECLRYDQVIAHVANQRIELDLDDGVKVNYAKFQGVKIPRSGGKPLKADLLAKI
jgi:type II restriction/modification system DNA methylase subunit YeeA